LSDASLIAGLAVTHCLSDFVVYAPKARLQREMGNIFGGTEPSSMDVDSCENARNQTHSLNGVEKLVNSRGFVQIAATISRTRLNRTENKTIGKEPDDSLVYSACSGIKDLLQSRSADQAITQSMCQKQADWTNVGILGVFQ
jgi:hypothetical protein